MLSTSAVLSISFSLLLTVPVAVLLMQCLAASGRRALAAIPEVVRPRIAVLIPAHNEAAGVVSTLKSLLPQLAPGDRLLLVADNCSDDTAQIAAYWGAEVIERHDTGRRGKGYALDFGLRHLEAAPPEIVIIVDADCIVADGALNRLARTSLTAMRPVQALYLMTSLSDAGPKSSIAEFAWLVKNLVRPLGFHRVDLPCQLMGTGMAFPWSLIASAQLANGHIVEDMKLGVELAKTGAPPLFCPEVRVSSYFPGNSEGRRSQRTRWEHGHLSMIVGEALPLLYEGVRRRDRQLSAMALDLCVPPLALLMLLAGANFAIALALLIFAGYVLPAVAAALLAAAFAFAVMHAWWNFGREVVGLSSLGTAAAYAFWKIPLYVKFLFNRQVEWVRSKRDSS